MRVRATVTGAGFLCRTGRPERWFEPRGYGNRRHRHLEGRVRLATRTRTQKRDRLTCQPFCISCKDQPTVARTIPLRPPAWRESRVKRPLRSTSGRRSRCSRRARTPATRQEGAWQHRRPCRTAASHRVRHREDRAAPGRAEGRLSRPPGLLSCDGYVARLRGTPELGGGDAMTVARQVVALSRNRRDMRVLKLRVGFDIAI